jgi:signal transduction histidine kinase
MPPATAIDSNRKTSSSAVHHGRLVRHYFIISAILISGGLITSGLIELYFRYQENWQNVARLQHEITAGAVFKIDQFIAEIERAMRATTKNREITEKGLSPEYFSEMRRLQVIAPDITECVAIDAEGVVQLAVSRLSAGASRIGERHANSPAFQETIKGATFYGTVYFLSGAEPHITLAIPIERFAGKIIGVLQSEINLKRISDLVYNLKIGTAGSAYIVARSGDLVAHPRIGLVLERRNLASHQQVQMAFRNSSSVTQAMTTKNVQGRQVFASSAIIPHLDWAVITEQPLEEAYKPLYASVLRTASLLLFGLAVALVASYFVARRVIYPLRVLGQGARRIGDGDLGFRVKLETNDEIETLADEFNKMAGSLEEAYARLEEKVAERTRELGLANQQLDEASRHKSAFLANMSHELRTPLNAIIGFSEVMLDSSLAVSETERRQFLADIFNSGKHLLNLINEVLDLAKIEAGRMELQIEPASLLDVVDGVHSTMRPLAAKKAISLESEAHADPGLVLMDAARITQVLLNLVGNAVKFTPEGGRVWTRVAAADGVARVEVGDTGPGIAPHMHEKIFNEFHQLPTLSTAMKPEGTGLGLALAKKLVEMHGGRIWLESDVGLGCRFFFTLPNSNSFEEMRTS